MGDKVTFEYLQKALKLKWRVTNNGNETSGAADKKGKIVLSLNNKERCNRCGKKGHQAADCWAKFIKEQLS